LIHQLNMWCIQAMTNRRWRNNAKVDEIAHAIHRIVGAMQPIATQLRVMILPPQAIRMEDVLKHKPSKFSDEALLTKQMLGSRRVRRYSWCLRVLRRNNSLLPPFSLLEMLSTSGRGCNNNCRPDKKRWTMPTLGRDSWRSAF